MDKDRLSKSYEPREVEARWYPYWKESGFFHGEDRSDRKPYSIVIPPPNVTGMLHMGHALNNTLQDIIIRYRRMQGYNAMWMPGTDHAGIATQNVVEQDLSRKGQTRHDLGREKFIEKVWEWREKYGGIILNQLEKLGCSCDWERERFTMDEGLSRAVREVFVRLYRDDLVYRGDYIVNWCPRCHTAISDLEVEYEEEKGGLWYIRYPYADGTGEVVVATTRPETMLGDTAVAVNPEDARYRDMVGKMVILPLVMKEIPIIADDYVSIEFGTGAVKITPSCDPNDFAMAQRHDIDTVIIMDGSAVINENGGPYKGQDRFTARKNVIEDLKKGGYLIKEEPYTHNVGRCYRCKTIIEPAISKQWFVRVKPLAKVATAAVIKGRTRIVPKMWEGTYFDWMENIRDWCISRQIWWGHRIPVWYCDDCGEMTVAADTPAACAHCKGTALRQEEDVLDTWFSSALWPFSTLGWPDETEALKTFYPTSLLVTGFDILFFWVARMMMMGLYVMKEVPFRDVYLHALVRDEQGDKMSKSKGNIIDPLKMIEKFGADAFRFTLAAFTAQGRDVRMSEDRIEGYRNFVNKIWNAARFSLMNLPAAEGAAPVPPAKEDAGIFDRWILDRMNRTVSEVVRQLDDYRFNDAASALYQFIWHEFCDWYLEWVKPVLYGKGKEKDKKAAQDTLRTVLVTSLKMLHPFMPFVTEEINQKVVPGAGSIMVDPFPAEDGRLYDEKAVADVALLQGIVTAVRNIRGEVNLPPSRKLRVRVLASDNGAFDVVHATVSQLTDLANLESLEVVREMKGEPKKVATGVAGPVKVYVFLEGMIDFSVEKARLEKDIAKIARDLQFVSRKLANRDFREKASPEVVRKEEEKFNTLRGRNEILENALNHLQEWEKSGE